MLLLPDFQFTYLPVEGSSCLSALSATQLSLSFLAPCPTFLEPAAGIKFRMCVYFQKEEKNIVDQLEH